MSTPIIRAATADDVIAIVGLLTQLNRAEGNPATVNAAALARGLFGDGRVVNLRGLVAVVDSHVVAAALYYSGYDVLTAGNGYHLADFVVEMTFRRRGIGRKLFAALAAQNLAEGGEWMSLTVLRHNETAQKFYAMLGMAHVPVDFFAIGPDALHSLATLLQK